MNLKFVLYLIIFLLLATPVIAQVDLFENNVKTTKKRTGKRKRKPTLQKKFSEGLKLFEDKDYQNALVKFSSILKKYPAHEPSAIYSARSLYKLKDIDGAFKIFNKLDLNRLDVESSYEYAQTHYDKKDYVKCLEGFKRVPSGHAFFDLANYYGSICAMKNGDYETAEKMLESAEVLPTKLAKRRKVYESHIQKLLLLKQSKDLSNDRSKIQNQMSQEKIKKQISKHIVVENKIKKRRFRRKRKKKKVPPKYAGYSDFGNDTKLGFRYYYQNSEFTGFGVNEAQNLDTFFNFTGGVKKLSKHDILKLAAIKFNLNLTFRKNDGIERSNILADSLSNQIRSQVSPLDKSTYFNSNFKISPFVEAKLKNIWLTVGGFYQLELIDFNQDTSSYARGLYLHGRIPMDNLTVFSNIDATWALDKDHTIAIFNFEASAGAIYQINKLFSVDSRFHFLLPSYTLETFEGPENAIGLDLGLSVHTEFKTSFATKVFYTQSNNYATTGTNLLGQTLPHHVVANGSFYGFQVGVQSTPLSWLSIGANYNYQARSWEVHSPNDLELLEQEFETRVPNVIGTLDANISINLLF